jgi:hypothetical protein
MKRTWMCALLAAALAAPAAAGALPGPAVVLAVGSSFGANHEPSGGGYSAAASALWPAGGRARFGGMVFADDIGTKLAPLTDPHNGVDLGTTAQLHRMVWGIAWRGEGDLQVHEPFTLGASSTLGWWRVQDDRQGSIVRVASAVGGSLGVDVRWTTRGPYTAGLALRYHHLFNGSHPAYTRTTRYSTLSLEWRWLGHPAP